MGVVLVSIKDLARKRRCRRNCDQSDCLEERFFVGVMIRNVLPIFGGKEIVGWSGVVYSREKALLLLLFSINWSRMVS